MSIYSAPFTITIITIQYIVTQQKCQTTVLSIYAIALVLLRFEITYILLSPEDNSSILLTINSCSCLRIVPFQIMIGVSQLSFNARSKFEGFFSFNLLAITGVIILAINNFITLLSGDPNFLPVSKKIKNRRNALSKCSL